MTKKTISRVVCAACVVLAVSCDKKAAKAAEEAKNEKPVFAVNTTTASAGEIEDYLALSGDIVAASTVDVFSDAAGKISRVYVSNGSRVRSGQPVALVDPSKPGMSYTNYSVRAPISGIVVALPAQVGMTISQAVSVARISGTGALEIALNIPERFISKIAVNQKCEVTLDAYPGELFRGNVREVSPVVDSASRTMAIKVNVENQASRLKAGMFAKVKIITQTKTGIVKIPAGALVERMDEQFVFTIAPDPDSDDPAFLVAKKTYVKPGINVDNVLEIQEGLAADEEIISKGQSLLSDGARIRVIARTPAIP
ncbi:MAG: efflux RND transporter periplasmic adaptor subunit [Spirochaetaceae bacterium]|jgi:multidrug efflux pump subunit AcrA (membrane-fusion protein)|nr:efflux RND transporter periplasmic adaptor subunit [Spirochaetaceae bacterium]